MTANKKEYLKGNYQYLLIFVVIALALINSVSTFVFKEKLKTYNEQQEKLKTMDFYGKRIVSELNGIDMNIRGYLLTGKGVFLDGFIRTEKRHMDAFKLLKDFLEQNNYTVKHLASHKKDVIAYYAIEYKIVDLYKSGNNEAALEIVNQDHGKGLWQSYMGFFNEFNAILEEHHIKSKATYESILQTNIIFQIMLAAVGIPILLHLLFRIKNAESKNKNLFLQLNKANKEQIFDDGKAPKKLDAKTAIDSILLNLKRANTYITNIADEKFDTEWKGINQGNHKLNESNLAGRLANMRDKLKEHKEASKKDLWISSGLTKLAELIRNKQDNTQQLSDQILSFLIKYLGAQQGSLFLIDEHDKDSLQLASCYAFDRKKHVKKNIAIGEGMLGQTFLEGQTTYITDIPKDYIKITSGLGDSTPKSLIMIPLIHNEVGTGILEFASFQEYNNHEREFIEQAAEIIAATLVSIQNADKTNKLLENAQQQAEELRAQEEEMRQNTEELEATQEEMERQKEELEKTVKQLQETKA